MVYIYKIYSMTLALMLVLYIIFNYGFMQMKLPYGAGFGVPIGEIMLIIGLLLVKYQPVINVKTFYLFLIWWIYVALLLAFDVPTKGFWALRDASHVIESLYVLVGFSVYSWYRSNIFLKFNKFFIILFFLVFVYMISYLAKDYLLVYSPMIVTGGGYESPFLFHYANTSYVALAFAITFFLKFNRIKSKRIIPYIVLFAIVLYLLIVFPSRTLYLQILGLMLFMVWVNKKYALVVVYISVFIIAMLSIFSMTGIEVISRTGVVVNLEYIVNHFLSITGVGDGDVQGSAEGVGLRLSWWINIYNQMISGVDKFLFGLGYGDPLVDFVARSARHSSEGQIVREPHNSYISIVARSGVIGIILWVSIQVSLVRSWMIVYKKIPHPSVRVFLNFTMLYSICLWILAIGEDSFEKPYNVIPYYCLWGLVLGIKYYEINRRYRKVRSGL